MSSLSDYAENKLLDHLLGTAAYTAPTTVYIGLATQSFTDANSSVEISGNNYARKAIAFDSAASGATDNTSAVEFNAATGTWGTITHFGIFDASAGNNLLVHGAFTGGGKAIASGDVLKIDAGDLDITAD